MRVALCGPMGSGKSWLAQRLIGEHGFHRVSLARGVKMMGERIMESLIEDGLVDEGQSGVKQRHLLQTIGAVGREIDPMMWINDALSQSKDHERVVVDDLRFLNEAVSLADYGFMVIRLRFPDRDSQRERLQRAYPDDWQRHFDSAGDVSETEMERIPPEMIELEMTVKDGDDNWLELMEHLWLT